MMAPIDCDTIYRVALGNVESPEKKVAMVIVGSTQTVRQACVADGQEVCTCLSERQTRVQDSR